MATPDSTNPADPTFLDGYLPYLLRRADQTLSEPFYAVLTRYGVARSEWRVLAVLHQLGPMGVVDLADAALSPQPTVTHAVRRLEQRGLVSRRPGATDRRQRIISVTGPGAELTETLIAEATHLSTAALHDAGDLTELIARLRDLTESMAARIAATPTRQERAG